MALSGVRSMVCIGVPLVVGLVVGEPQAGAAASFGGLAGLYVAQAPYRYRARVVAAVGAGWRSRSWSAVSPRAAGWPPRWSRGCSRGWRRSSARRRSCRRRVS